MKVWVGMFVCACEHRCLYRSDEAVKSPGGLGKSQCLKVLASQHLHDRSQESVIPVPGDPTPLHRNTQNKNTNAHEIRINKKIFWSWSYRWLWAIQCVYWEPKSTYESSLQPLFMQYFKHYSMYLSLKREEKKLSGSLRRCSLLINSEKRALRGYESDYSVWTILWHSRVTKIGSLILLWCVGVEDRHLHIPTKHSTNEQQPQISLLNFISGISLNCSACP